MTSRSEILPGPIALFGSGETSPAAQRIHHEVMSRLSPPVRPVIIETPAGFEPNSEMVARKIADYLQLRLQNFHPQTELVPARKRGTEFSPEDPALAEPIFRSNFIFMGPGSPTYAVRQLQGSYTWQAMLARHRLGAAICFSSAASIAVSKHALPVYEVYKVGEDLHWKEGLDFFSHFGLDLLVTPHWNNNDGGDELDTSHCYLGQERYEKSLALLPELPIILGIEENTGVVIDPVTRLCHVVGVGQVIVRRDGQDTHHPAGSAFSVNMLGKWHLPEADEGIPEEVWTRARDAQRAPDEGDVAVPAQVQRLVAERESARTRRDWSTADRLRDEVLARGWQIEDTPDGPNLVRLEPE